MTDTQASLARSFDMVEDSMNKMWDMWTMNLESFTWTQEQLENMARRQLDQNQAIREETIKLVEDLSRQMRRNQEQFRKIIEETVMNTYEHINYANQNLLGDLSKKVEEIAKKAGVDALPLLTLHKAV